MAINDVAAANVITNLLEEPPDKPLETPLPPKAQPKALPRTQLKSGLRQLFVGTQVPEPILYPPGKEPISSRITPPTTIGGVKPYELPKVWTEQGMEAIGQGIAKIPVLPKILQWAAPAFEFIHERLEKPWAATLTALWSPTLPYKAGESWLEHEKREYDAWEAPTYVKGAVEFAMPLWWLPYFGWAAKGARALGIGDRIALAAARVAGASKIAIPTGEALDNLLFKGDWFKTVALWAENKPVLHQIVKKMGGEAAFVSATADDPVNIAMRAYVKREVIRSMADDIESLLLPRIQKFRDIQKILGVAEDGMVTGVKAKPFLEDISMGLSDVIEHPGRYILTQEQGTIIKSVRSVLSEVRGLTAEEGIKISQPDLFHRLVKGRFGVGGEFEPSDFGSLFEVERHHKTMEAGIKAGVVYDPDILRSVSSTIRHTMRRIADKRFDDEVKLLGTKPIDIWAERNVTDFNNLARLSKQSLAAADIKDAVSTLISYSGEKVPGATVGKLRRELQVLSGLSETSGGIPRLFEAFAAALTVKPAELDKIVSKMGKDILKAIKMDSPSFKELVVQFNRGKDGISLEAIVDALKSLKLDETLRVKAIDTAYKEGYLLRKQWIDDTWKFIKEESDDILKATKEQIRPIKARKTAFLRKYIKRPRQILGEFQSMFPSRPALKNLAFPKQVVDTIEPLLKQTGQDWLKATANASGLMRMMTATLDSSVAWIQGLPTYGRFPTIWAKGALKQFEFAFDPARLFDYMEQPLIKSIRTERMFYGASGRTFEFFQALAPLQRGAEKIPFIGKQVAGVIRQTYGRAEAAFAGFGEIVRNNLWVAMKRPNMSEVTLRDLARTIDRMTGIMDVRRLAIGLTQQQLEQSWVFFSPSYTRAGFSFMADMFKGGITGAEARKSIASMLAAGATMYYGTCKLLGQQPDFDPSSARFMTIKVGEHNMGIGGIHYSLTRLVANVVATATGDTPSDFLTVSRYDNPFIKFLYSRSAPLTGLTLSTVIEKKDFLGRPFEGIDDWAKYLGSQVMPIALQPILTEEKPEILATAGELAGFRTSPKSPWQRRTELRDQYAMEEYQMPYDQLPVLSQRRIDAKEDIKILTDDADARTIQLGDELSMAFLRRKRDRNDAWFLYNQDLQQAEKAVNAGVSTGYDFKERLQKSRYGYAMMLDQIDRNPDYMQALEKIKAKDITEQYIGDIAYDELMNWLFTEGEDEYGIFRYDAYDEFLNRMKNRYGDAIMAYVEARQKEKNKELPKLAQEYFKAVEILRPYWDIETQVIKQLGVPKNERQEQLVNREIAKRRKLLRDRNPELDKYYRMFYSREEVLPKTNLVTLNLARLIR